MANKRGKPPVRNPPGNSGAHQLLDRLIAERRFAEACAAGEQTLARNPKDSIALHRLGIALIGLKDYERATAVLRQATLLAPQDARIHNDLAIAYEKAHDFVSAESAYLEALRIAPALAEAHSNLADLLFKLERPDDAIRHAEISTRLAPANPLSWVALGETLQMQGKNIEAIAAFEKAVQLPPPQTKAFCSLARAYAAYDRKEEAIVLLQKTRNILGDDPKILNDLGLTLGSLKRYPEAQIFFEMAYAKMPEPAILYNVLTNLGLMRKIEDMFKLTDEVLKHPQPNVAISPLFGKSSEVCQWQLQEKLLPHFLEWCAIDDRKMTAAGHSLLSMLPIPSVKYAQIRNISERVTATYRRYIQHYRLGISHEKAMQPSPKLRIGYLSGDFKMHPVNYFVAGQLSNYDKQFVEVYCYSNLDASMEDDITEQYRAAVDCFVPVAGMDDVALAQRIAADGIQLLIDLSGYTGETRLGVMFHKPAPLQLTYLGYPFTTGLKEVDYVLSDPWLNGPNNAGGFVEEILEIPHSFISFSDFPATRDDLAPPLRRNGHITFGSLNNSYKLNRETIAAWSRILQQVPTARLILNHPNYALSITQENILSEFERHDVARDRISIVTQRHPSGRHLNWYLDIDIALDAFPQTGGTTTTEALWMGVPVVTLVGDVHYERLSYSVLKNCGTDVEDLIAFDLETYIARSVSLAHNPERIAELHRLLPTNIRHSLLCDPARQVRFYEQALIEGWNRKFPAQARFTAGTFAFTRLSTPAAPLIATAADPDNLHHYVIEEQGSWFAPEYGTLARLAKHLGGCAVEIGSEPGFFSLELAQAGMPVLSLSTSTVAGRMIQAAADKDGIAHRLEVRLESARTDLLDRANLKEVTLLRLGVEVNDGNAGPIIKNPTFWKNNAPVVLLSVHSGNQTDMSAAEKLAAMGYRLYRLLPGLGCFVPHKLDEALDPYTLSLLACPPERESVLVAGGMLVTEPKPVAAEEVAALSNPGQTADPLRQMDEWIVHCAMQSREPGQDAAIRLGYLQLALKAQQTLVDSAPSTTRRISLARLLADSGRRAEALASLNQALAEIEQGTAQVTMPFLAPAESWDRISPGDRLAEWLFAALIETRCRLAAHSTYFLSTDELGPLALLPSLGFETDFSRNAQRARLAREGRK